MRNVYICNVLHETKHKYAKKLSRMHRMCRAPFVCFGYYLQFVNLKTEVSLWKHINQMFSVHTTPEELENLTVTSHFGFVSEERKLAQRNHVTIVCLLRFQKASFSKYSVSTRKRNLKSRCFQITSGLKRVFVMLRFCDGLVWTVGLTVEIKSSFHFSLAYWVRTLLKTVSFTNCPASRIFAKRLPYFLLLWASVFSSIFYS